MKNIDKLEDKGSTIKNVICPNGRILLPEKSHFETYEEVLVGLYRKLKRENSAQVLM